MNNEEQQKYMKKQAETINTLADNQRVLIDRLSKLENRDTAVDTELAINKAVEKIVTSVKQQTTPTTPVVPAAPAPAPVVPAPVVPAPAAKTTEPAKPVEPVEPAKPATTTPAQ